MLDLPPRVLDLNSADDRRALLAACGQDTEMRSLVEDHLDEYVSYFRAPEWRVVYSGGLVSTPKTASGKHASGFSIETLLRTTQQLSAMRDCKGFQSLVANLSNPTQVSATLFEIEAASWCSERGVHTDLEFSPEVQRAGGVKYPDFLWRTTLGDLFCECKAASEFQRNEALRLGTLADVVARAMEDVGDWPDEMRLDVLVEGSLGRNPDARLATLVRTLGERTRDDCSLEPGDDHAFSLVLRPRDQEPPQVADSVTTGAITVSTTSTELSARNARFTVTRALAGTRAKLVSDLVKEAKKQLPDGGPGAVFVQMGGADTAAERLKDMLAHPAHSAIVWTCLFTGGAPRQAVWRDGQPFDGRLLNRSALA